jgi:tyrosinase
MKTPLNPFKHPLSGTPYTSEDCMNIETQLGYTYGQGSLEKPPPPRPLKAGHSSKSLMVSGIDRALFQGSFLITAWASIEGADGPTTERYLGHHAALSRFSVIHCANCRTHLEVVAHFPLDGLTDEEVSRATFRVHITHRGDSRPAGLVTKLSVHD